MLLYIWRSWKGIEWCYWCRCMWDSNPDHHPGPSTTTTPLLLSPPDIQNLLLQRERAGLQLRLSKAASEREGLGPGRGCWREGRKWESFFQAVVPPLQLPSPIPPLLRSKTKHIPKLGLEVESTNPFPFAKLWHYFLQINIPVLLGLETIHLPCLFSRPCHEASLTNQTVSNTRPKSPFPREEAREGKGIEKEGTFSMFSFIVWSILIVDAF